MNMNPFRADICGGIKISDIPMVLHLKESHIHHINMI